MDSQKQVQLKQLLASRGDAWGNMAKAVANVRSAIPQREGGLNSQLDQIETGLGFIENNLYEVEVELALDSPPTGSGDSQSLRRSIPARLNDVVSRLQAINSRLNSIREVF